jgi:hypothetical protein
MHIYKKNIYIYFKKKQINLYILDLLGKKDMVREKQRLGGTQQ